MSSTLANIGALHYQAALDLCRRPWRRLAGAGAPAQRVEMDNVVREDVGVEVASDHRNHFIKSLRGDSALLTWATWAD